ncbi:hypothetical protein FLJC2902T_17290 [Flavobacterium limnosediminis JC2902]|uniref:Uncharacterized protein n=2 Tax=Flavobacterium TaxID=237 RepID=V6SQ86_9FLAO|nr:hypothetical protein FLJC2902T_17290 [Flavobacterium limnosediminis JC2902]
MDNYRIHIAEYNELIREKNEDIKRHNEVVKKNIEAGLNEMQIGFKAIFLKKNGKKRPVEFNELADEFNAERGLCVEKKNLLLVKYGTEVVFGQILHLYSKQIASKTKFYMGIGTTEKQSVKPLSLKSNYVTELQRNGVQSIDVCNKTIRNHRDRLEEAGVLTNYFFAGIKRAVKYEINSQILVVFDAYSSTYATTENQHVTNEKKKVLPVYYNECTRTNKINIKIKENVENNSLDLGTAQAPDLLISFLQEHDPQGKEVSPRGAAENVKVLRDSSEKLKETLLHEQELAVRLAAGEFNYYQPIDIRVLYHEALNGTMTREEFKSLIIQEFMKSAARLYRTSSPFVGSWKKAINAWMQKMFIGNNHLYRKDLMVDKLQEYRWRLNHAHKWFTKYDVKTLYPGDYFDFTRTEAKEIGFQYTKKAYLKHKAYQEAAKQKENEVNRKAKHRKERINYAKKFDQVFKRFFNNRISLNDLLDYVKNNLPKQYEGKLTERLLQFSATKYTC